MDYKATVKMVEKGGYDLLLDPAIYSVANGPGGKTVLHRFAVEWIGVLSHPEVAVLRDAEGVTPLHIAALYFKEALYHPAVSTIRNNYGSTPLHWLATHCKAALLHPDVGTVRDNFGCTPLETAAFKWKLAFDHPAAKVMNEVGNYLIHEAVVGDGALAKNAKKHSDYTKLKNREGKTARELLMS